MNKSIMLALGLALLAVRPLMAADGQHAGDFCMKHCTVSQLKAEVKSLEKSIAADKAALKSPGSAEKLATLAAKNEKVKKHLDQHIKELEDLKAEADKAETELNQLERK